MKIARIDTLPPEAETLDFSFEIEAEIVAPFEAVPLRVEAVPPRRKAYGLDEALFEPHDGQERVLFLARDGAAIAGYLSAHRDWNGCAVVQDLAIARPFRRRGLAAALMDEAVAWTRAAGLGAIRLETQSVNAGACRFYQSYGFVLGGYDRFLYRELAPEIREEIALFWYLSLV